MTQTATKTQSTHRPVESRRHPWLATGLVLLGLVVALVATLGPLIAGVIQYHASEGAVNQIIGGDVAALVLVAPVSILAGALVWRGQKVGLVLALAPAAYGLYMYSQLALGGDVLRYEGNSERFFPLFLGLFLLAGWILVTAWKTIDERDLPVSSRWVDRSVGVFFLVVAFFLTVGLHLPGLVDAWADQPTSTEYLADPVVFWLVKFMDLAIVVPVLILTGVGVLKAGLWSQKLKYAVVGWAALLGASVAGMAIVMQVTGDPAASTANTIAFSTFAAIAIGLALATYVPLFRSFPAKSGEANEFAIGEKEQSDR